MSRRRRLDGEVHLAFGICHGRLMLALLATGVRVAFDREPTFQAWNTLRISVSAPAHGVEFGVRAHGSYVRHAVRQREEGAAAKPGSAGKAGLNQRIRVIKFGTDSPDARAAAGEEGQIIADGASDEAFEGYWRRPDADARALHEGWYFTGDTGYVD